MGNLTTALIFVMFLNVIMVGSQLSIDALHNEIDPTGSAIQFLTDQGNVVDQFDTGNYSLDEDIEANLPGGVAATSPSDNNIFVDVFTKVVEWFKSAPGVKYLYMIVTAPYYVLKTVLPQSLAFLFGALWDAITVLLIIAFIFGRDA